MTIIKQFQLVKSLLTFIDTTRNELQAEDIFHDIEGYEDMKELLIRAIQSEDNANTGLIGPPAAAKSLFLEMMEQHLKHAYMFNGAVN